MSDEDASVVTLTSRCMWRNNHCWWWILFPDEYWQTQSSRGMALPL